MSHFSLSIIVPCFDEQAVIVDTYNEINDVLSANNFDIEIIFIDDGSIDDTFSILHEISEKDSRVKIISFSRNFGHQAAVTAGLDNSTGDVVSIIDADSMTSRVSRAGPSAPAHPSIQSWSREGRTRSSAGEALRRPS